jgi:vacuolar protein 8
MMSPNVEVQCNAVGCITNLATHEDNKAKIARSGALGPLTRLAKSKDMRVQRNATGALLNMTHSGKTAVVICAEGELTIAQMKIDNNWLTQAPFQSLCNSFLLLM